MNVLTIIARVVLGFVFVVFGSNAFLHFIPMPPLPATPAGNFIGAMIATHYIDAVAIFEIIGGLLLLVGRYVPLGLALLGPVVVNILLYHVFMDRAGSAPGIIVALLSLFLLVRYRSAFRPLLMAR
ncbi:MAG: hypothetical protein M3Y80_10485 [Verrucomicrobiota bacterium]|nr:hypothetical protein [Verrucomicrobiota bacterium]